MAGIKISGLPSITLPALTDVLPTVQAGVTYKVTNLQLQALFGFSPISILGMANGGTGAALVAANGAIPYSTATALALLAPGSSGQLLQSQGAGAPIWTTATFPTTAGTTGQVLVSDGTNFSASFATLITALGAQSQALNMNSHLINNVTDPVSAQDAATKNYVDQTALNGTSVYAASTTNLTVTQSGAGVGATLTNAGAQATFALDSVNPPLGSNVLIKNLAAPQNEGIYTVTNVGSGATNWVLTRATSYDTPTEINNTGLILVINGTTLAGTAWLNSATIITVDTTPLSYSEFGNITFPISLAHGGTQAALTPSNGGIFYSNATTGAILAGTATAGQMLQSGANAAPAWSTTTYPATNAVNTLLYASSANVMGALATVNSAGLLTSAGGVPGWVAYTGTGAPVLATSPTLVTPTLGAATATSLTFSPTTGGIVGTTTNDNTAAGDVGEFISSVIPFASAVSLVNVTPKNVTSISLTAGDWDVWGNVFFTVTSGSNLQVWVSSTSATLPDVSLISSLAIAGMTGGGFNAPKVRFSLSGTTTIFLSCNQAFTGTGTACGGIFARRRR